MTPKRLLGTITKNSDSVSSFGYDKVTTNISNCFFYIVICKEVLSKFDLLNVYHVFFYNYLDFTLRIVGNLFVKLNEEHFYILI